MSRGRKSKRRGFNRSTEYALGEPRPLRRSKRNTVKVQEKPASVPLASYDSCIKFITNSYSTNSPSTSINSSIQEVKDEVTKKEVTSDSFKEDVDDEFSKLSFDFMSCSPKKEDEDEEYEEESKDQTNDSAEAEPPRRGKKRKSIHQRLRSGEKIDVSKKRKLKNKSILSKFRESHEKLDVIIQKNSISETKPLIKPSSNESVQSLKSNSVSSLTKYLSDSSINDLLAAEESPTKSLSNKPVQSAKLNCAQSTPKPSQPVQDRDDEKTKSNESTSSSAMQPSPSTTAVGNTIVVDDSCNDFSQMETDEQSTELNCTKSVPDSSQRVDEKTKSDESTKSTNPNEVQSSQKPNTHNDDIVIIDDSCNDFSQMEMNAYHEKFNLSSKSLPTCSESIIIIDADDEPAANNKNEAASVGQKQPPKANEDCLVVWSSVPTASTSKSIDKSQSSFADSDILKQDKILLDTSPNMSNYRCLNNENNKPKKKIMRPPNKVHGKGGKKSRFNMLEKAKDIANKTAKSAAAVASNVGKKTSPESRAKSNEDLIFLSDKRDATKKNVKGQLREIVIDGSNVGMAYTNGKAFSEQGIKILIDYFIKKGHTVKVFVPQYRRSTSHPLLEKWYTDGTVVFTPSRKLGYKHITPYDDRYILGYATACGGIVVSQDQFRDLYQEKPEYRDTIENRLLVPTFVGDYVMFPEDPLGRNGPTLANFLRH